jgi:vanillate O-demethylase ferredoxin subunit
VTAHNPSRRLGALALLAHRWVGLLLAPLFAYMAITGSLMLLQPGLQPVLDASLQPAGACQRALALDPLLGAARARHPGSPLRQLELSAGAPDSVLVRFADLHDVYLDACTGQVLGERERWGGAFGTVEWLHRLRFVGDTDVSETLAGSLSLVLALMVAGGLLVWWLRHRRAWRTSVTLKPGMSNAVLEAVLHRSAGVAAALVVLAVTAASWTLVFDWAHDGLYRLTGSPAPLKKPKSSAGAGPLASADALLAQVRASLPQAQRITLVLPKKAQDPVEAQVLERDAPHANARSLLYLDAASAAVLRLEPYASSSAGYKAYRWAVSLHTGQVGGVAGQLLQGLGILCVPLLAWTGWRNHLRRRARERAMAQARASVPAGARGA